MKKWAIILIAIGCTFAYSADALAQGMTFSLKSESDVEKMYRITMEVGKYSIYASGDIEDNSVQKLTEFLKSNGIESAKLYLDSRGGSLLGGILLGEEIRNLGFDTQIGSIEDDYKSPTKSICASACAFAYAGGVNRFYSEYDGKLGIHQFSTDTNFGDIGQTQQISGIIVEYLGKMGIDPQAFAIASGKSKDEIAWLSPAEAQALNFSNNGKSATKSEIKLVGMQPYLRLEQVQYNVTARVLLACDPHKNIVIMAGIVTDEKVTQEKSQDLTSKTYLEFDGKSIMPIDGTAGIKAQGSVIWVQRTLSPSLSDQLSHVSELGMWLDGYGGFRWGATIDLTKVQADVSKFRHDCLAQ